MTTTLRILSWLPTVAFELIRYADVDQPAYPLLWSFVAFVSVAVTEAVVRSGVLDDEYTP